MGRLNHTLARSLISIAGAIPLVLVGADLWIFAPVAYAGSTGSDVFSVYEGLHASSLGWLLVTTSVWIVASTGIVVAIVLRLSRGSERKLGGPFSLWRILSSMLLAYSSVAALAIVPFVLANYYFYPIMGSNTVYRIAFPIGLSAVPGFLVAIAMFIVSSVVNTIHSRRMRDESTRAEQEIVSIADKK